MSNEHSLEVAKMSAAVAAAHTEHVARIQHDAHQRILKVYETLDDRSLLRRLGITDYPGMEA